jgi:AcrR family transcriptional regulator
MANVIKDRDRIILDAAVEMAKTDGYQWLTRDGVAAAAGVAPGTINTAFTTIRGLKRAVLREAVEKEILVIIAQGLADQHEIVRDIPAELKARAVALLTAA